MKRMVIEHQELVLIAAVVAGLFAGAAAIGCGLRQGQPWAFAGHGMREIVAMVLR